MVSSLSCLLLHSPASSYTLLPPPTLSCLLLPPPALSYTLLPPPTLSCLLLHSPASSCTLLHSPASSYTLLPPPASSCTLLPPPASSYTLLPPPTLICLLLPPPALSCLLLHSPASSCTLLPPPTLSCLLLHSPASSYTLLPPPASSCTLLPPPASYSPLLIPFPALPFSLRTIYEKLGGAVSEEQRTLYTQRVEEISPNVRYCAYNMGDTQTDITQIMKLAGDAPGYDMLASKIDVRIEYQCSSHHPGHIPPVAFSILQAMKNSKSRWPGFKTVLLTTCMMYMFIGYTRIPAKLDIRLVYPAGKFGAGVKPRAKPKARQDGLGSRQYS